MSGESLGPQLSEEAAALLVEYRTHVLLKKAEDESKPDMQAYRVLNHKGRYCGEKRIHGEIPGVPIGTVLQERGEAAILGIHCQILSGIDGLKDKACYAICASGGYVDDEENRKDGCIVYTGEGGKKGKKQVKDQVKNTSNRSLILAYHEKSPIRVLTGKHKSYTYEGLFQCIRYEHVPSSDGPLIFRFTLKPIEGKSWVHPNRVVAGGAAAEAKTKKYHKQHKKRTTSPGGPSESQGTHSRLNKKLKTKEGGVRSSGNRVEEVVGVAKKPKENNQRGNSMNSQPSVNLDRPKEVANVPKKSFEFGPIAVGFKGYNAQSASSHSGEVKQSKKNVKSLSSMLSKFRK